jgi:hypothetical protein
VSKSVGEFQWDKLTTSEQFEYFDWVETLQATDILPMDMSDEEFMEKCYRMYMCDRRQGFDPDDDEYLSEWFKL